jgi:hypothetical protein
MLAGDCGFAWIRRSACRCGLVMDAEAARSLARRRTLAARPTRVCRGARRRPLAARDRSARSRQRVQPAGFDEGAWSARAVLYSVLQEHQEAACDGSADRLFDRVARAAMDGTGGRGGSTSSARAGRRARPQRCGESGARAARMWPTRRWTRLPGTACRRMAKGGGQPRRARPCARRVALSPLGSRRTRLRPAFRRTPRRRSGRRAGRGLSPAPLTPPRALRRRRSRPRPWGSKRTWL